MTTLFAVVVGALMSIRLLFMKPGTIVAVVAADYIPYIFTRNPVISISDATHRAIANLYSDRQTIPLWLQRQHDKNEARAMRKSNYLVFSSKWASRSATHDYGIPPEKVFDLPFGPNISASTIQRHYVEKSPPTGEVKILFVGADWDRKGGERTLEVSRLLVQRGINVSLILVGKCPQSALELDFVQYRGFLRKSDPTQLAQLCQAYSEAHFLLLPTKAEAFGIVFSEAQAFGVPPVAYDVGGTSSAMVHRKTGLLLPPGASAEQFVQELLPYICQPELYREMSNNCRQWYLETAQWEHFGNFILRLMSA